jgi:ATP/ADP translocase
LRRIERDEDHTTRRLARVLGGIVWLVSAALILAGLATAGWLLTALIAILIALDAALDFCALCFVVVRLDRLGLKLT